jgi:hypothetical protein
MHTNEINTPMAHGIQKFSGEPFFYETIGFTIVIKQACHTPLSLDKPIQFKPHNIHQYYPFQFYPPSY